MTIHPDYPPHNGDAQADRCVCGGIRHWHAIAPHGCDDCDCTSFRPADRCARCGDSTDLSEWFCSESYCKDCCEATGTGCS